MANRRGRAGRPWERLKAHIQTTTTNCWRCGKHLDGVTHKWPHPLSVTVGHIIAHEDCTRMGIDVEDPTNLRGECIPCNTADGARRTNAHRAGKPFNERKTYRNTNW